MTTVEVRSMPVVCSTCGAERMTLALITEGDERTEILTCPCGELASYGTRRRHTATALVCGSDGCRHVSLGEVWT